MWSKAPCSRTLAFKLGKADSSSVDVSFDLEWGDLCFFFFKDSNACFVGIKYEDQTKAAPCSGGGDWGRVFGVTEICF